jgi:hypothetical protein
MFRSDDHLICPKYNFQDAGESMEAPSNAVGTYGATSNLSTGVPVDRTLVDKPAHYHGDAVINFIEEFNFGFHISNVIKYCARADLKGKPLEDLEKARWYLDREIARRKRSEAQGTVQS